MENKTFEIEMDALAMEYRAIQAEMDSLAARLETVKDDIKGKLGDMTDYRTPTFHFIFAPVTSNRFDSTAFKKDNPVIAAQYMKASVSRPLKIN